MNDQEKRLTKYFLEVLQRGELPEVEYGSKEGPFCTIPKSEVDEGQLTANNEITNFFKTAERLKKKKVDSIEIVISIISVREKNSKNVNGLLNVPATLYKDGTLAFDTQEHTPWIPCKYLETENTDSCDVMVGSLEGYWDFELNEAEELRSHLELDGWQGYLKLAKRMFKHVDSGTEKRAQDGNYALATDTCYVKPFERISAVGKIIELYKNILDSRPDSALYKRIIALDPQTQYGSANSWKLDERTVFLEGALKTCGGMSFEYSLADSQRRAVHACQLADNGDVLAVSGPPGTGKTTMLQSIVASLIVEHALEEKDAPVVVGTSANNQAVTNMIDSFCSVTPKNHGTLDFRWLPKVDGDSASEETVEGIAAYCPSQTKMAQAQEKGYLTEDRGRNGIYTGYSNKDYVDDAYDRLLGHAETYFGRKPASVEKLKGQILGELRSVDKLRREALEYFEQYVHLPARDYNSERQTVETQIKEAKREYRRLQERLSFWEKIEDQSKPKGLFARFKSRDDAPLIAVNRAIDESILDGATSLEEVLDRYQAKLAEISRDVNAKTTNLESVKNAQARALTIERAVEYDKECIKTLCDPAKCASRETKEGSVPFGFEFNPVACRANNEPSDAFLELDKKLDITLRYIEFWLAVHYYECCWLLACTDSEQILSEDNKWKTLRHVQDLYWKHAPSLTPCFVMTEYKLPDLFRILQNEDKSGVERFDYGRIDLLITDEAGQVNTPIALPAFALAKKAVVVGDVHQLAPIWSMDEETDKRIAFDCKLSKVEWTKQTDMGLTCSQPSSLMRVAANACKWRNFEDEAGLFLEEHYRCVDKIIAFCNDLIYKGRLKASRGNKSKLKDFCQPFVFKLVKGTKDIAVKSSRHNPEEAAAITAWISENGEWLSQQYEGEPLQEILGVVTPFSAQAATIKQQLRAVNPQLAKDLTIGTAHSLQGAEKPVILFSSTYGENSPQASFVNSNPELMNVAVSRAKDLFIVFGAEARRNDQGAVFKLLNQHAELSECRLVPQEENAAHSLCDEDIPTLEEAWVIPEGENYVALSKLIGKLNLDPSLGRMSAKNVNPFLKEAGLIQQLKYGETDKLSWFPTIRGYEYGIRIAEGTRDGEKYVNTVYPDTCKKLVKDVIEAHMS